MQESFGRVWRSAGCFDARRGRVGAFLFVISRSAAADIRNRPSSRSLVPAGDFQLPPLPDGADRFLIPSCSARPSTSSARLTPRCCAWLPKNTSPNHRSPSISLPRPGSPASSRRLPSCQAAEAGFGPLGLMLQHLPPALKPPPDLEARTIAGVLPAAAEDRAGTHAHQIPGAAPAAADTGSPRRRFRFRSSPRSLKPRTGPAVRRQDDSVPPLAWQRPVRPCGCASRCHHRSCRRPAAPRRRPGRGGCRYPAALTHWWASRGRGACSSQAGWLVDRTHCEGPSRSRPGPVLRVLGVPGRVATRATGS